MCIHDKGYLHGVQSHTLNRDTPIEDIPPPVISVKRVNDKGEV
jgi:hypothetical protein